jgi:hypothetical protein
MNTERIKELAKQAGLLVHNPTGVPTKLEKFAEFLVQECTGLLLKESERLYAYSSECSNGLHSYKAKLSAEKCLDNIKMLEEHFGVEE